jgi:hypothetical protein
MTIWPNGAKGAVAFTFDFDAEEVWIGDDPANADRPGVLSQGTYGAKVAVPLILELLERHGLRQTFFVPGRVAERHPDPPSACFSSTDSGTRRTTWTTSGPTGTRGLADRAADPVAAGRRGPLLVRRRPGLDAVDLSSVRRARDLGGRTGRHRQAGRVLHLHDASPGDRPSPPARLP